MYRTPRRTTAHLQSAGVRIDGRQSVDEERKKQQKRVEHGHTLQQENGRRLGLVFTQHEERRDITGQSEHAYKADDDRTHDKLIKQTSGFFCVRILLDERRKSHVVGAFHLHIVKEMLLVRNESGNEKTKQFSPCRARGERTHHTHDVVPLNARALNASAGIT